MVKLAPSNNPEKESKLFAIIALVSGVISLFFWFFGVVALGAGVRGAILSQRVGAKRYLAFSIIGIVLGGIALGYYYMQ